MKTKQIATLLSLFAIALALSGCTSTAKVIKALEKDRASFKLRVTTIYGNIDIQRVNPGAGHSASLSPDGLMKVEWLGNTNAPAPIPVAILPQGFAPFATPATPSTITPEMRRALDAFYGVPPVPNSSAP